jgi:hypothetical protein
MLESTEKNYMLEIRDIYCSLCDCQPIHRKLRASQRKAQNDFSIREPIVNIICATTPESFREYTTVLDLSSGWLVRIL